MQKAKKDYLTMLSVREIRLEAKKSSIHLYSRKNKRELVELILKDRETVSIKDKSNYEVKAEEEIRAFENVKAEEERKAFENVKAEEEKRAFENVKAEEERKAFENVKAEEEKRPFENVNAEEEKRAFENAKAEEERKAFENVKAEEERKVFENANTREELIINSVKHSYLKKLLSKSFPNKNVSVTDNKDGSQTILIY